MCVSEKMSAGKGMDTNTHASQTCEGSKGLSLPDAPSCNSSTLSASTIWTVTVRGVLQRQNTTRRLSRSHSSHHSKERKIVPKSFRLEFCWCFPSTGYSGQGHRPHVTSDECDRCDAEAHECRRSAAQALTRGPQLPAHTWGPDTARAVTCFIL